jgi:NitT/TauT family transport system substrate-binding protein
MLLSACGRQKEKAASSPIAGKPEKKVKIAYLPITHAMPLFIEKELGDKIIPEIDFELVKFGSWPELLDALNTGHVDGASVLIELAMKAKEQGIGLKAVALGHTDGNVVIVSKEINSAADVKGKTVAIPHRQSSHFLLVAQMLKDAGLTINDVNLVELPPPEMPSALAGGQIDSYCVAEPFGAKSVAIDTGKVLFESGELWDHSLCCALVLTDQFISEKNEVAKEFVAGYKEAGKYISANQDKIYDLVKIYLNNLEKPIFDISVKWISYDDLTITESYYADLLDRVIEFGLSKKPPTYHEFIDASLY